MRAAILPVSICACVLALTGCGGTGGSTTSTSDGTTAGLPPAARQFLSAAPGRLPKAAPSNAIREIPAPFRRTMSVPLGRSVLLTDAVAREAVSGSAYPRATLGIIVGIRNPTGTAWAATPSKVAKLSFERGSEATGEVTALGATAGPCAGARRPGGLTLESGQGEVYCLLFAVPDGATPLVFRFASTAKEFSRHAAEEGGGYAAWVMPGTLLEKCLFTPGEAKGKCDEAESEE